MSALFACYLDLSSSVRVKSRAGYQLSAARARLLNLSCGFLRGIPCGNLPSFSMTIAVGFDAWGLRAGHHGLQGALVLV